MGFFFLKQVIWGLNFLIKPLVSDVNDDEEGSVGVEIGVNDFIRLQMPSTCFATNENKDLCKSQLHLFLENCSWIN